MAELLVELVAPDRKVWSGEAGIVIARTTEGEVGIQPGHLPLLAVLQPGPVTVRTTSGEDVVAAVRGGFVSVSENRVSVLAEEAELAHEIDVEAARAQLSDGSAEAQRWAETRLNAATRR